MLALLLGVALAGPLRLAAPAEGTAEILPQAVPGRIDVLIRPVSPDLKAPLGRPPDGVRALRVVDLGGTAVLTLWPVDPTAVASVTRERRFWEVRVWPGSPGTPPLPGPPAPPPREPDGVDPGCGDAPRIALVPLHGADMMAAFPPGEFVPVLPEWALGAPHEVSWARVAAVRAELNHAPRPTGDARSRGLYELGAIHRDLGFSRESAYYFAQAWDAGAPPGLALLQRAGALLRARDWEAARNVAAEAIRRGAPEAAALEVEGSAALFEARSSGPAIGFAIAADEPTPEAALVAGALLLRSGCFADAVAPLGRATASAVPFHLAMARFLLSDALLLAGDLEGAGEVLQILSAGAVPPGWEGSLRARSRLLVMLREPPTSWPAMAPSLHRAARGWDEEGAEALFLLGQIGQHLGDERLALESYAGLVDRWRHLARGEPGRRLQAAWSARTSALLHTAREPDALAVHSGFWRPTLLRALDDPAPLAAIADGYARLGLYEPALETLAMVADLEGQLQLDDRATIVAIARAYLATGRLDELSDTLDFLATRPADPLLDAHARLLRGRMLELRGDRDAARAWLATVIAPPELAAEATLRMAVLDAEAGRCVAALAALPVEPDAAAEPGPGVLLAARARCLLAVGRGDEGRATARAAGERMTDPASVAALRFLAGQPPAEGVDDVWARIARADTAWEALRTRAAAKKPSTSGAAAR